MKYTVISKDGCPWCDKAITLLDDLGLPYSIVKTDSHPIIRPLMLAGGLKTVPQVFADGEHIGGYEALMEHLDVRP